MDLTISEILSNLGHEIRTPMNAIAGFSNLLEQYVSDESQIEYVKSLKISSEKLFSYINNILDLSKIETAKLKLQNKEVSLISFMTDIVNQQNEYKFESNKQLILKIDEFFPDFILIDELRLNQILINLISIVLKQSKCELCIEVKLTRSSEINNVEYIFDNHTIDFCIILKCLDKSEAIKELDKYFHNLSSRFDGDSLVFYLTNQLINLMNGKLCVANENNQNLLRIDFHNIQCIEKNNSDNIQTNSVLDYSKVVFNNCKIVLADDVRLNRAVIKELFRNTNVEIIEAVNGEEAIFYALKHLPDLILMDIKMPILDGYEAFKVIKKDNSLKNIPVIAISASLTEVEEKEILQHGFNGFLLKPVHYTALYKELVKYLKFSLDTPVENNVTDIKFIDRQDIGNWNIIVEKLENEIYKLWQIANDNNLISDILNVSEQIAAIAKTYNVQQSNILTDYSNKINRQARSFDIENLKLTLGEYPNFIDYIKRLI